MRTHTKLALLSAFALMGPTLASGAERGFQGVPWGATQQTIQHRFAGQVSLHKCEGQWADDAKFAKVACDGPYIERYEVLGIPFRLEFYMSEKTHKLKNVGLSYSTDQEPTKDPDVKTWQDGYYRLYHALVIKYGPPRTPAWTATKGDTTISSAKWATNDTVIELNSLFRQSGNKSRSYGDYSISYLPANSGPSGKL